MVVRPETKRLLSAIEYLERSHTASEIAKSLGVVPAALSGLKMGRTNAGNKLIQKFIKSYKINNDWLFTGEGEMFGTQAKTSTMAREGAKMYVDDLVPEITRLKDQYRLLQDEYRFISDELRAMKEKMHEAVQKDTKKVKRTKKANA